MSGEKPPSWTTSTVRIAMAVINFNPHQLATFLGKRRRDGR